MTHPFPSPTHSNDLAKRLEDLEAEREQIQQQIRLNQFAASYETQCSFPAVILNAKRTNTDLIQHRLLEAGILYDTPVPISETLRAAQSFIQDLEQTDCFHAVKVELGGIDETPKGPEGQTTTDRKIRVTLEEKQWYRLHLGGGVNALQSTNSPVFVDSASSSNGFMPSAGVEASIGLRNLTGHLDLTDFQYTLNTQNIATVCLQHQRPLYSILPPLLSDILLSQVSGSQYHFAAKAVWDTLDWEATRSYKELQQYVSMAVQSHRTNTPAIPSIPHLASLEWKFLSRDIIPRRHPQLPYQFASSREVLSQAGASIKHSFTARVRGNILPNRELDDPQPVSFPTYGLQYKLQSELATPPGDVGFIKTQGDVAVHLPIIPTLGVAMHLMASTGLMSVLEFGGLCAPTTCLSDRFSLGGPANFRGFSPSGIGPRARPTSVGPVTGDDLGGDFFYKLTGMISMPASSLVLLASGFPVRVFGFGTVGTCASIACPPQQSILSFQDVLRSSRLSLGVGIAINLFGPRVELTYAWPLRYGPRDRRRNFQFGTSVVLDG